MGFDLFYIFEQQSDFCVNFWVESSFVISLQCAKDSHHVDGMDVVGESVMSIEALFLLLSDGGGAKAVRANLGPLKECLQCVVRLCRVQPEACDQFVDIIGGMLHTGEFCQSQDY